MKKVALMLAPGFEEIEALTVVDVLRRADISCDTFGFEATVTGSHGISVQADKEWEGTLSDYDMLVLPGGMPGSTNLRDDAQLIAEIQRFHQEGRWIAAICAAPIVLNRAGVLEGHQFTCFDGIEKQIQSGQYLKKTVVVDGNIVTSRGASTALAFSYQLAHILGGNSDALATSMLYKDEFGYQAE